MEKVLRVTLTIHGARDYPMHYVKIPMAVCADLPNLMNAAETLDKAVTVDDVIRAVWRLGIRAVFRNISHGISPSKFDVLNQHLTREEVDRVNDKRTNRSDSNDDAGKSQAGGTGIPERDNSEGQEVSDNIGGVLNKG